MSGVATAMVAAAVIGGVASNKASKKAAKASVKSSDASIRATQQAAEEARGDVNRLFPQAQQVANQGFRGALGVFGESVPAQFDVFQQGNVGAQQQVLAGLPQIQNAILGGNVDLSGLQPFQVQNVPTDFLQQQTPFDIQNQIQAQQQADAQAAQQSAFQAEVQRRHEETQSGTMTSMQLFDKRALEGRLSEQEMRDFASMNNIGL